MKSVGRAYDIVVYDRYGQPAVLVEIKARPDLSESDARRIAEQLWGTNPDFPSVKYLLVLTPSRGYLWRIHESRLSRQHPEVFPMEDIVTRYGGVRNAPGLAHMSLEYLADRWLSDLALGQDGESADLAALLRHSGLIDVIAGGEVRMEVRV